MFRTISKNMNYLLLYVEYIVLFCASALFCWYLWIFYLVSRLTVCRCVFRPFIQRFWLIWNCTIGLRLIFWQWRTVPLKLQFLATKCLVYDTYFIVLELYGLLAFPAFFAFLSFFLFIPVFPFKPDFIQFKTQLAWISWNSVISYPLENLKDCPSVGFRSIYTVCVSRGLELLYMFWLLNDILDIYLSNFTNNIIMSVLLSSISFGPAD